MMVFLWIGIILFYALVDTKHKQEFYENVHRWRRTVRCCQNRQKCWKHTLEHAFKDLKIERLNLEQDISNIGGQNSINNALLQAYQASSYKLLRINYSKPS